jgi:hypothetical protein
MSAWHLALQNRGTREAHAIDSHAVSVPGRLSPEASAFTVDWFGIGVPLVLIAAAGACAFKHVWQNQAALAAVRRRTPLRPGRALLSGEVETGGEPGPVVMLSIEQTGRESQSRNGITTQLWTETGRSLTVRPFYIVLASGERVRVEPDGHTRFAGKIDSTERIDPAHRRRIAEVAAGARITVSGVLEHGHDPGTPGEGYRGSGEGFVLHPPKAGHLRLSLTPPGTGRFARSSFHMKWAAVIAVATVLLHGGLFLHFHLLRIRGQLEYAEITDIRERRAPSSAERTSSGRVLPQFFLDAAYTDSHGKQYPLSGQVTIETTQQFKSAKDRGQPMLVPFLIEPSFPTIHQAGTHPTIESYKRGVTLFLVLTLALIYGIHAFHTRPWHARRRLVETDRAGL